MAQILVTKPGALNQRDRAALRRAGVVVVEAENPNEVKLINAEGEAMAGGDMLLACLRAISGDRFNGNVAEALPKMMLQLLEGRRAETEGK